VSDGLVPFWVLPPLCVVRAASFVLFSLGVKAPAKAGRGLVGRAATVLLLPVGLTEARPLGKTPNEQSECDGTAGEVPELSLLCCSLLVNVVLTLRRALLSSFGVNPNPPNAVLAGGLALAGAFLIGDTALAYGLLNIPSLVPGLLELLPFRLSADAGRGGGPIGDPGEKKLDLRRSFGVAGMFCKLSIVLSDRDGLDRFRWVDTIGSEVSTYGSGSKTSSSRKPCLEAVRKLSIGPS